jgi:predicted nuclease with TOPRIM domain
MPDLPSVLISAATAFAVALGLLFLAHRAGLTDLQREVDRETDRLATALRVRVETLETENKRLQADIDYLKRENAELREQLQRLRDYIITHKIEAPDLGA